MPRVVLDMMDRRPIWAMPDWVPTEIRGALPDGWELIVIEDETDGSGDGAARVSEAVLEAVAVAEIYMGYGIPEELLLASPELGWVHSGAAGVGSSLTPTMLERPLVFTNSAKIHGPPIAETVIAMMMYFARGLDLAVTGKQSTSWANEAYYGADAPMVEVADSVVGVIGYGGIGREVANRAAALGATVLALGRRPSDVREGSIERVSGAPGLERILTEADTVVLCAPDTPETRGMMDGTALARMKRTAVLINVGRGKLVDEASLARTLSEGGIRGAGLDVFAKEPLPEDSPLWALPNVLITPHVSAVTRGFWRRETDLILHNLACYLSGSPAEEWRNVVDKQAGY